MNQDTKTGSEQDTPSQMQRATLLEWQTEDDNSLPEKTVDNAVRTWPRRRTVLGFLLLIVLAGLLGYRYVQGRIDQATAVAHQDVLTSHQLGQQAARQGDGELLRLLLPEQNDVHPGDPSLWLRYGLDFERGPLGLVLTGDRAEVTDVQLSSDLREAQVTSRWLYRLEQDDRAETVALEYVNHYRFDRERWLLASPDTGFWGDWQTGHGQWLTLTYPERDTAVAQRLVQDLDAQLAGMCQILADLPCPTELHLSITLDSHPDALHRLADPRIGLREVASDYSLITLPSPTLVGTPVDEAGYQALYRWYAVEVVAAVIAGLVEWSCCDRFPFFQALLDKQLSQLGLRPWPVTDGDYEQVIQARSSPVLMLTRFWNRTTPVSPGEEYARLLYAFIDFSQHAASEGSLVNLQQQLGHSQDFATWVQYAANSAESLTDIDNAWRQVAYEQLAITPPTPAIALPNWEVYLACQLSRPGTEPGALTTIHRYNPLASLWTSGSDLWLEDVPARQQRHLTATPLPDYQGVLLRAGALLLGGGHSNLYKLHTWQGDNFEQILDSADFSPTDLYHFAGEIDPTGQQLLLGDRVHIAVPRSYALANLAGCQAGNCHPEPISGRPLWSPDGQRTVIITRPPEAERGQEVPLLLGDALAQDTTPAAEGYAPFWLDNETYGFVQKGPKPAVYTATVTGDQPRLWLELAEFEQVLPAEVRSDSLRVRHVAVHPTEPDWLFLLLAERSAYLVSYRHNTGEITFHISSQAGEIEGDLN
jgi:hypothetical protein